MTTDKFINRLIALTVCTIGLGLTTAYIHDPRELIKEPLLLVIGSLLTALRLTHNDEPIQVPAPSDMGTNPSDL